MSSPKQQNVPRKLGPRARTPETVRLEEPLAQAIRPKGVSVLLDKYTDRNSGNVVIERLIVDTGFTKKNLAGTLGVSIDTLYRPHRVNSRATQVRIREMLEILGRITQWAGGETQAMAWYRGQPIPAFGGRTAESLVKNNQAGPLREYLDHMTVGGFT
ncbi:MAG TPA: hypothetical protein VGV14_01000 [Rhodanobacter sp.]|nr:hypothetical protein [Rhodanobacter sp.]